MIHNPIRKALPDLSNPGAAGDLRSGKQLVGADGTIVTGTLAEVQQATPSISVSSGGLITATTTQSSGIVAAGSKSATQQLPTQEAKTVIPGTTTQTAVAAGRYSIGAVQVQGDANLKAENIAEGVNIFGVTGTYGGGAETVSLTITNNSADKFDCYLGAAEGKSLRQNVVINATVPVNSMVVIPGFIDFFGDFSVSSNVNYRQTPDAVLFGITGVGDGSAAIELTEY